MKIALIGYGKMGKMIEKLATARGHTIVTRIDSKQWDHDGIQKADSCIEFTHPESVIDNVRKIAEQKKPIIIGTTGWHDQIDTVQTLVKEHNIGALYGSNFSIGVHLFLAILSRAAQLMNAFSEYDVAGIEYHHNAKKDSPSGTAIAIAKTIETNMSRIDQLPFSSVRCGSIPGTHTILFDSPCDTITLTHEARNREGFALGAVLAAEWLKQRKGLYTFDACIQDMMKQ